MLSSDSFTRDMLSNPNRLAKTVIDLMESTDTSGALTISDPNNGFIMGLFADVSIFAQLSQKIDYVNSYYYRNRSRSAEQLYEHISEYDYVGLMASPATLPFVLRMSKDWVVANAAEYDANYNLLQIPATSYITMGGIRYSMYYPIDILVNKKTEAVDAFYNTDVQNNLFTLESNLLLDTQEYTQDGITYFQIKFNMFQFERSIITRTVGAEQGFNITLPYEDQFYAVKVFRRDTSGNWVELAYSLAQLNYDYQVPTALIRLLTDVSQVKISIPQVYFNSGQMSQNVRIELYTTRGAVNYSLSATDITGLTANFDTSSSPYAAPLEQMPVFNGIVPSVVEVQGGSNAMTYAEMRDAVINNRLHSRAAITLDEIVQAGLKAGFNITRHVDDITERIYFASNILRTSSDMIIPTFVGSVLLKDESLAGNPSTIISYTDGYKTLLPTTVFKVESGSQVCIPLTDAEVETIEGLSRADLVTLLNEGSYVRQPFHITLLTNAKSPKASIYNLLSPNVKSLSFVAENSNSAPQLSALAVSVTHQNDGTGGYRILMSVERSANIRSVDVANFNMYLTCTSKIGEDVYIPATYIGADENGDDIWEVILATNYRITTDDNINVEMFDANGTITRVDIDLDQTFNIVSSFNTAYNPNILQEAALNGLLPITTSAVQTVMCHQRVRLELGVNLSERIYCGVNTSWANDVYDVADETVYFATEKPIYQTNEIGVLQTRVNELGGLDTLEIHAMESIPPMETDLTYLTTASVSAGVDDVVLPLSDTTGILPGMRAWGTNLPVGCVVVEVDEDSVLIDLPTDTTIAEGTEVTFANRSFLKRVTVAQSDEGAVLEVADTTGLIPGLTVFGFGIATGSTIVTVDDATHFTLSLPTTEAVTAQTLLTIKNMTAPGVIKTAKGEVLKDDAGRAIVVKAASNQYRIPTILFDGRLFASDMPDDQAIVGTIAARLQNFANQIETIDAGLTEGADVYYKPARTMGLANFGIGNSETVRMDLALGFVVTVYVDEATYNTQNVRSAMTETIHRIINEQIQLPMISSSQIATTIEDTLGTSVSAVEVDGINGDSRLRLIALLDSDASPSIEDKIELLSDGSIDRVPNITVTYISKPSTVDSVILDRL